jgi:transcriptional regulator with XRE-family HTH domain
MMNQAADGIMQPLQVRRLTLGLSRERLGAAAGGISQNTVYRIEHGLVNPHPATRAALARALGCKAAEIFPTGERGPDGGDAGKA